MNKNLTPISNKIGGQKLCGKRGRVKGLTLWLQQEDCQQPFASRSAPYFNFLGRKPKNSTGGNYSNTNQQNWEKIMEEEQGFQR